MDLSLKGISKLLQDIEERNQKQKLKEHNKKIGYAPKCTVCNDPKLDEIEKHLFVPAPFFEGSIDDLWKHLPELDAGFEERRKKLEAEGKRLRFVATVDHGKTSVALKEVDSSHPFYNLEGSTNIVMLTTERYKEYPMLIQGYGAGASVTAAGVFANIMSIANI